jgi:hypothetical protein
MYTHSPSCKIRHAYTVCKLTGTTPHSPSCRADQASCHAPIPVRQTPHTYPMQSLCLSQRGRSIARSLAHRAPSSASGGKMKRKWRTPGQRARPPCQTPHTYAVRILQQGATGNARSLTVVDVERLAPEDGQWPQAPEQRQQQRHVDRPPPLLLLILILRWTARRGRALAVNQTPRAQYTERAPDRETPAAHVSAGGGAAGAGTRREPRAAPQPPRMARSRGGGSVAQNISR